MRCTRTVPPTALALLLTLLVGGCAYQLGPTNSTLAGERSVYVEVFTNETLQPRLEDDATQALRRSLQRDGTFRLAHKAEADVLVTGVVTKYERQGLSYDPRDLETVRDFNVTMVVRVKAVNRADGEILLDRDVVGITQVSVGSDLPSAERQAAPLLAGNFARNATDLLVDGTW